MRKNYRWGLNWKRIGINIPNQSPNYSYLGCFSLEGMYAFVICKGGFTQDCFFPLISQILNNYKKENPQSKILIIMDNAKKHKGKIIKNYLSPF